MNGIVFYPAGESPALAFAVQRFRDFGFEITKAPGPAVTHLLLPVPSFDDEGYLRGGGELGEILVNLPDDVTVVGGNLDHPLLEGYKTLDLLRDERYLCHNAAITADCAIKVARNHLPVILDGCPALILGWGRIGKALARLLRTCGAEVTVAVRKERDIAMLQALGYRAERLDELHYGLMKYRVIFNTVPALVLGPEQMASCDKDCVKIELASRPGMTGADVVQARGLPGKDAPESAGLLIAKTVMGRLMERKD